MIDDSLKISRKILGLERPRSFNQSLGCKLLSEDCCFSRKLH
jgi:hypothetical protein